MEDTHIPLNREENLNSSCGISVRMAPDLSGARSAAAAAKSATIALVARDMAFSLERIPVPAGALVSIEFENRDEGVPHNFALYENESAEDPLFVGEIVSGPAAITYVFEAPDYRGDFFFRCDVHPTLMRGRFVTV